MYHGIDLKQILQTNLNCKKELTIEFIITIFNIKITKANSMKFIFTDDVTYRKDKSHQQKKIAKTSS